MNAYVLQRSIMAESDHMENVLHTTAAVLAPSTVKKIKEIISHSSRNRLLWHETGSEGYNLCHREHGIQRCRGTTPFAVNWM